jgi:hypothetical protein
MLLVFYHPLMSHQQRQRGAGAATQTQFFKQSKEGRAIVLFGLVLGASTNVGGMDSYGLLASRFASGQISQRVLYLQRRV